MPYMNNLSYFQPIGKPFFAGRFFKITFFSSKKRQPFRCHSLLPKYVG